MDFREFFEVNPGEVAKAAECANFEEFKKLVDENEITYKDEEEVKSAYNFIKGESGELSDDLLEAASGGKSGGGPKGPTYKKLKPDNIYKNHKGDFIYEDD